MIEITICGRDASANWSIMVSTSVKPNSPYLRRRSASYPGTPAGAQPSVLRHHGQFHLCVATARAIWLSWPATRRILCGCSNAGCDGLGHRDGLIVGCDGVVLCVQMGGTWRYVLSDMTMYQVSMCVDIYSKVQYTVTVYVDVYEVPILYTGTWYLVFCVCIHMHLYICTCICIYTYLGYI